MRRCHFLLRHLILHLWLPLIQCILQLLSLTRFQRCPKRVKAIKGYVWPILQQFAALGLCDTTVLTIRSLKGEEDNVISLNQILQLGYLLLFSIVFVYVNRKQITIVYNKLCIRYSMCVPFHCNPPLPWMDQDLSSPSRLLGVTSPHVASLIILSYFTS